MGADGLCPRGSIHRMASVSHALQLFILPRQNQRTGTTRLPTGVTYKRLMTYSISISVIYAVAAKTNWLSQDPMLWFCLMLMPTGPPAMKLTALADVNGSRESEKMAIAKFLTVRLPLIVGFFDCRRSWS